MSVVIVGGNDRMVRQYKDLCQAYRCRGKVFTQMSGLKERFIRFARFTSWKRRAR